VRRLDPSRGLDSFRIPPVRAGCPVVAAMTLPVAWLVDVDGTLALHQHRNPHDWRKADADLPNMPVVTAVQVACSR
jgi:hypothetical protein